jgi:nucleoside-diphosphate-sugar epimerase
MNKKRLFFPSKIWVETNYVFIEDVVQAHINALQSGTSGEKYIVGGVNSTYSQFISTIKQISKSRCKIIKINYQLIKALLEVNRLFVMVLRRGNIISPTVLDSLFTNRKASTQKGVKQLKYNVTSLAAGVEKTVSFLKS